MSRAGACGGCVQRRQQVERGGQGFRLDSSRGGISKRSLKDCQEDIEKMFKKTLKDLQKNFKRYANIFKEDAKRFKQL